MNGKIPYRCHNCGKNSYHNAACLSERPLDRVTTEEGFECPHCGMWEPVFYTTISLLENISQLEKLPKHTRKFRMLMAKTLSKASNLRSKASSHGESKHKNVAPT